MIDIQIDEEKLKFNFMSPLYEYFLVFDNYKYYCYNRQELDEKLKNKNVITRLIIHNSYCVALFTNAEHFNCAEFRDFLQAIVNKVPFFAEYELVGLNQNFGTIEEYLQNKITKLEELEFLYHGTSSYYADIILKEGIKPRKHTNVSASFAGTNEEGSPNCIYLCTHPRYGLKRAGAAAMRKSNGENTLLKIDIAGIDKSKLKCCDQINKNDISIEESLLISKNLRYFGTIEPNYITNEGIIPYNLLNIKAMQYYASKENNDLNRASTDSSMQGK
jgi:hypothetical protein